LVNLFEKMLVEEFLRRKELVVRFLILFQFELQFQLEKRVEFVKKKVVVF